MASLVDGRSSELLEVPIEQEQQQQGPELVALLSSSKTAAEADTYAMPATQGQVRFWSLDQLNPGNPALNMPLMWQFTGTLSLTALTQAFAQCVQRHEVLRTTFEIVKGDLSQIIHPSLQIAIPLIDLTGLSGESQRVEADGLTRDHAAFRFDLKRGPLLVLKLLKLSQQHHVLLVTMHHIICDGISNGVLMRDMIAWYQALLNDSAPHLAELPIQFADYAVWHEQWRASEEPAASLEFWHKSLGNGFTPIHLKHDLDARASLPSERLELTGDIETLLIPPDLVARAHSFCIQENVTLNMLLFSIFCGLLSRLTGQKDLTIGSPCANRNEDTQELIGLFMNIQILRVRLEETSSFRDLLRQIKIWTLGAYENQTLPFEDLIYDPFFSESGSSFEIPIFFLYQKSFMLTGRIASEEGDLEIVPLRSESPGAVFEVMFAIVDREEEGPRLQLEYNPQYFKNTTIQHYLRLYINLLESSLATPDRLLDELSLISETERSRLIVDPNRTTFYFGPFEAIHQTFLRRAVAEPDAVAVECNNEIWTNAQLAVNAGSLARRLVAEGLRPGDLVAIGVYRSLDTLCCVLAVMMAGGAYVPLDILHPRERLETILENSGAAMVLINSPIDLSTEARIIDLRDTFYPKEEIELPSYAQPETLAYVIYTSGSTGTPKGVAIEHGSLTNLLRSMQQEPGFTSDDTLVAVTTVAFDIAALELLLPLLTGARLIIATRDQVKNPSLLLELLEEKRATVLQATPGVWRALIDAGWTRGQPNAPTLKALCGGEALTRELAELILDRTPDLWNLYGPTETTIWSSATRVHRGTGAPRLGAPIANTQLYVLDKNLEPTPSGLDGDLYIGGVGVARGYWNKPELTAERFLSNPFGLGRVYWTGDLARRHEDGTIEILGRSDFQVKIRGYRIELGEIETALTRNPSVREAIVIQHTPENGAPRLVAFVDAGAHGPSITLSDQLTEELARALPDYMRPYPILALPEMPRNTNGKVDRNALLTILAVSENAGQRLTAIEHEASVAPKDVIERQITELWQSTLNVPRISTRASFFSLGVGSLAALRLITKMNRVYDMDLGLATLISASTIESISELVRGRFAPNTASSIVPIQPVGTKPPLFIVHGVGGNVVNFYGLSMRMGPDQPVYGIQSQALVSGESALIRLKDMAALYLAEARKVQPNGPYKFLGYSFGGTVVLEMAHQLRAAGETVALLGMLDSRTIHYDEELSQGRSLHGKVGHRVTRFSGNISDLSFKARAGYIWNKISTRAIRYACMIAAKLNLTRVPSFMKSAYDINYVAIQNYKLKPYDGHLILFRAIEQDYTDGAYDLGWGNIFRGGVEVHDLPGDHDRIFLEPNIEVLARGLRAALKDS